ncbi:hypothetical protein N1851_019490 [Merluccius polli]|uniref:Reverse transcriptase domain-containing protein n=1 Tax=Merluccius polli TaxID=89951 RepID=A0AA47NZK6_MERPO|nr:hypothetical protein N1851_019490 [Merluccius polli]
MLVLHRDASSAPSSTLFTHDCVTSHKDNIILKFADDTAVIGCITDRDAAAYRREVASLVAWCEDNNLTLNTDKTKEMIVDMRKKRGPHRPLYIRELELESEDLTWLRPPHSWLRRPNSGCTF